MYKGCVMEEIRKLNLKVLFVEDEDLAREKLGKFLKKRFEVVELCPNGLEGFFKFQESYNSNKKFDIILSDINMPKMDGLEMLEKIREIDGKVPCLLLTARTESENMMKAITLQVRDYILKPINLELITKKLNIICEEIQYKKMYEMQKTQMQSYLEIINQEAIVSRTDLEGRITFVNDAFCEISGFTKDELIGANHNIVRHPDVSKDFFKQLWETIKKGEVWAGTHKSLAKDGSTYFVSSKIVPIYDDRHENVIEYMSVKFLVTEEELEKRRNFKRFIEQVSEYKKQIGLLRKDKEEMQKRMNSVQSIYSAMEEKYRISEQKKKELLLQLEIYERKNLEYNKIEIMEKRDKTKQFEEMYKSLNTLKNRNLKLEKESKTLQIMYERKEEELKDFVEKSMQLHKRINDLKDLVTNLQKENEALRENKSSSLLSSFK